MGMREGGVGLFARVRWLVGGVWGSEQCLSHARITQ